MNKNSKEFQDYEGVINQNFEKVFGVQYVDVVQDLYVDGNQTLLSYWENGVDPVTAVYSIGEKANFLTVENYGVEYASVYNRMQAALLNYQSESDFMYRNEQGVLLMEKIEDDMAYAFSIQPYCGQNNDWTIRIKGENIPLERDNSLDYMKIEYNGKDISDVVDWFKVNVLNLKKTYDDVEKLEASTPKMGM